MANPQQPSNVTAPQPTTNAQHDTQIVASVADEPVWQRYRWLLAGITILVLVILTTYFVWNAQFPPQFGFNDKTVWDVLDLLVVPLALAGAAAYLNKMLYNYSAICLTHAIGVKL